MFWSKRAHSANPSSFLRRKSSFIDREFQIKFTLLILVAATMGILLSVVPIYYFLNQNYEIFFNLAYDSTPNLLEHLEREKVWINMLLFFSHVLIIGFFAFVGIKMTSRIIAPLRVLKNHLKMLSRGQWSQRPIKVRDEDEFHDVIETYNYFFNSYKVNLEKEYALLSRLNINREDSDSYLAWKKLVKEKARQLNMTIEPYSNKEDFSDSSSNSSPSPDSRHAS